MLDFCCYMIGGPVGTFGYKVVLSLNTLDYNVVLC